MVERTENVVYRNAPKGEGLRYIVAEVKVASTNDTVIFDELTEVHDTVAIQLDTGVEVACSEGTNVVTVGGAVANVPMLFCVSGW